MTVAVVWGSCDRGASRLSGSCVSNEELAGGSSCSGCATVDDTQSTPPAEISVTWKRSTRVHPPERAVQPSWQTLDVLPQPFPGDHRKAGKSGMHNTGSRQTRVTPGRLHPRQTINSRNWIPSLRPGCPESFGRGTGVRFCRGGRSSAPPRFAKSVLKVVHRASRCGQRGVIIPGFPDARASEKKLQ